MKWKELDEKAIKTRKEFCMEEGDSFRYYVSEMRPQTKGFLEGFGFKFDDEGFQIEGSVHDVLCKIGLFDAFVAHVYEGWSNTLDFPDNQDELARKSNQFINDFIWSELLGFSGDDDVDYNGSYLAVVIDAINEVTPR